MDARAVKRLEVLSVVLRGAAAELALPPDAPDWARERFDMADEYVRHKEHEVALVVLEDLGYEFGAPSSFWLSLKRAAGLLSLKDRENRIRGQYRAALVRERDANPGAV